MASRTLTAVFDSDADAHRAMSALTAHGIAQSDIQIHRAGTTSVAGSGTGASSSNTDKGFWESLSELFMPEDDRHTYAEAVGRGGTVMTVRLSSERWEEIADVLEANGAVDLDEREASWRSEGWSGRSSYASGDSGQPGTMLSRGADEVLGTNMSGAHPENEMAARSASVVDQSINGAPRPGADINNTPTTPAGSAYPGHGSGTASGQGLGSGLTNAMFSRGVDDAQGTHMSAPRSDMDDVAGTSMRNATTQSESADPPGTMLSRGADDVLGTNMSGARPGNEGMSSTHGLTGSAGRDESIPIVEETLRVGKRETGHGRVRIRSYVVETPVEEQVTLRSEHVEVERNAVDRPLTGGEDLFRERTIEATETQEEAVIAKEARVTEELRLRKETEQRTETVRDTVRRTEVEIERDGDGSLKRDI